jgi:hypothetical protein
MLQSAIPSEITAKEFVDDDLQKNILRNSQESREGTNQ